MHPILDLLRSLHCCRWSHLAAPCFGQVAGNLVEKRMQVANCSPSLLIQQSDQTGPQWGNGAGTANRSALPVDVDQVARLGIGIPCNIRYASPNMLVIDRWGDMRICLPRWKAKDITDTATCGTATNR